MRRLLVLPVCLLVLAAGLVFALPDDKPTADADGRHGVCVPFGATHAQRCQHQPDPTPKPTPKPVGCPSGMHEHWPFGCHNISEDHTQTVPPPPPCGFLSHRHSASESCHFTERTCDGKSDNKHHTPCPPKPPAQCTPGVGEHKHTLFNNQVTCHPDHKCKPNEVLYDHDKCRAKPPAQCTPGVGEHKHTLFNNQVTCHPGDHSCSGGQHATSTSTHGHVSGCHSTTSPAHQCPGNQVPTSATAHGHVWGCKTVVQPQCTPGPGEHKHTLAVNRNQTYCHAGDHSCPNGQHATSTSTHGHVSGCHSTTSPAHQCPNGQHATSISTHGHVSGCQKRVTADPKPQCPAGQYTAPTDLYVVNFGDGPLFWTIEHIVEYGGYLPWGTPIWEQVGSCYTPKEREPIDIDVLTPTVGALKNCGQRSCNGIQGYGSISI